MNKRYQVFISSTYEDLKEERSSIIQVLWELNCIPYGMEVFPATNNSSWDWIERAIKESDYFILILGGKYGSIHGSGISYTQKEYEYAKSVGIPSISFIVKEETLLASEVEKDTETRLKLESFKGLVKSDKNCRFYISPDDLSKQVSTSLQQLIKDSPRIGWIRADTYKSENVKSKDAPKNIKLKELPDGEIKKVIHYSLSDYNSEDEWVSNDFSISLSWNRIFYEIASFLFNPRNKYSDKYSEELLLFVKKNRNIDANKWIILETDIDEIMLFLMARNCVTQDNYNKWKLTTTGKKYFARLQERYNNQLCQSIVTPSSATKL